MSEHTPNQEFFKNTLEQMHEGMQIISRDWRYLYLNQAACLHGQSTKEKLLNRRMMDVYPGIDQTDMFKKLQKSMDEGQSFQLENEFHYPSGSKRWFELSIEPHAQGVMVRSIDITEKKKLQEQFWHAQKLDAIGQLAGNLAHDLHNKFNIMMLNCELALDTQDVADRHSSLNAILNSVQQCAELTKQLLVFSRKQVLNLKTVNLNALLVEYKRTLPKLMGDDVKMRFELSENLPSIRLDVSQFDQLLLNLCNNAKDAMCSGGSLTVQTQAIELNEKNSEGLSGAPHGRYALLSVTDTGCGMPKEVTERLFEPFFTTKARGKGTGLGLSTVHGIVKQCGGHILVESSPNAGTCFKIYFPQSLENGSTSTDPTNAQESTVKGGNEIILLVEDEPVLLDVFTSLLTKAGYRVHPCKLPSLARDKFKQIGSEIHLLLTDVVMPETNGVKLAQELRELRPDLKVVFLSGYADTAVVQSEIIENENILIQKPTSRQKLLQVVRDTLDNKVSKGVF